MKAREGPHFGGWEKGRRVIKIDDRGQQLEKQTDQGGFASVNAGRNEFHGGGG